MPETDKNIMKMPVVPMRGIVMFPDMTLHFDVGRASSRAAVQYAMENSVPIFIVTQIDFSKENPKLDELHGTGVISVIQQVMKTDDEDDIVRVVAVGCTRGAISDMTAEKPFIMGEIIPERDAPISEKDAAYETALVRNAKDMLVHYCEASGKIAPNIIRDAFDIDEAGALADKIGGDMMLSIGDKQRLLDETNPINRLEKLCVILSQEEELMSLDRMIHEEVQDRLDKNQREYYLREQLDVIYEELGEDEPLEEADKYSSMIEKSLMPDDSKQKLKEEVGRLAKMSPGSPDANVIRTYLDKCLALPWGIYTKDNLKLSSARRQLDKDHYGLKDVKERIIEMLAARALSPEIKGQIICLAGPPGVGKTSIARSVAEAMHRNYVRISLGGVRDEAEIRGHRRTYIGAIPGRIVNALIDAKSANPLILLDEVDKLSGDFRGDPAAALLEALDGEQNSTFCDHFIDMPFDLSQVLFITTANDKYAIPEPLRDRMEIIDITSYTHEEKFNIAKKHLIPKQLKEHNIDKKTLKFSDKAIRLMIDGYTKEAGVRQLERLIAKIARKSAVKFIDGDSDAVSVTEKNLSDFLGPVKFKEDDGGVRDEVGLVNGLAYSSVGGEMLQVEVSVLDGTGKLELTGSLGDVIKESAKTAVSLVRSRADRFGIEKDFYKTKDIHIHMPEGAVPKDGPSAGVTMTTALFSALSGVPVRGNVAMTGEITLRGRVLPIGGLKEKSMAAYRHGMKKVIIPRENEPDLAQIDDAVKEKLEFIPVKSIDEVLSYALTDKKPSGEAFAPSGG